MALNIDIEKRDPQVARQNGEAGAPLLARELLHDGGCLALIVLGFVLMSGGGKTVENGFNPEIFSTRRIVVADAVVSRLFAYGVLYCVDA